MGAFLSEYDLGEFVYLITDSEQRRWIVGGVDFLLSGATLYRLLCGTLESYHATGEFSREPCAGAVV